MVLFPSRLLDGPDAIMFLEDVEAKFKDNPTLYVHLLTLFHDLTQKCPKPIDEVQLIVQEIAKSLKIFPKLLRGLNALLEDDYQIEFSTHVDEASYFLFVDPIDARILSTSCSSVPKPSSKAELWEVLSTPGLKDLGDKGGSTDWLCCLAQLLQVVLDHEHIHSPYRRKVLRCLYKLAKLSILPPSLFLNNVMREDEAVSGGGFADIYIGHLAGEPVCIKALRMFSNAQNRAKVFKKFTSEVLIWRQLHHPNLLPLLGASNSLVSCRFCFISPWMQNGNIMTYLSRHPHHNRLASVREICAGLEYLHELEPPIIHKDIKGANILVTDELVCCLADFGLSAVVESQRVDSTTAATVGSMYWLAPELMDPSRTSENGDEPSDIFAFGCTIYEIFTGNPPHSDLKLAAAVMCAVLRGKRPLLPPPNLEISNGEVIWPLVHSCWNAHASERPKIQEVSRMLKFSKSTTQQKTSVFSSLANQFLFKNSTKRADEKQIKHWIDHSLVKYTDISAHVELTQGSTLIHTAATVEALHTTDASLPAGTTQNVLVLTEHLENKKQVLLPGAFNLAGSKNIHHLLTPGPPAFSGLNVLAKPFIPFLTDCSSQVSPDGGSKSTPASTLHGFPTPPDTSTPRILARSSSLAKTPSHSCTSSTLSSLAPTFVPSIEARVKLRPLSLRAPTFKPAMTTFHNVSDTPDRNSVLSVCQSPSSMARNSIGSSSSSLNPLFPPFIPSAESPHAKWEMIPEHSGVQFPANALSLDPSDYPYIRGNINRIATPFIPAALASCDPPAAVGSVQQILNVKAPTFIPKGFLYC